ncbi:hypothetical protein [Methanobrevibacter olleyae]|uniref:Uncharacterized protein n=1 Tax=Methanobrevibacter olleyae TaxID=294671 RepID=A0A126R1D1_METOL|nr:hypothetical protein [Methanobrevibacter olleyae]AMK15769.1 hypothetical protein YLM1_1212 [Methanobrevibacter olleyae]
MSYLINEIYELYTKQLEITEPILTDIGVEDSIDNYLIDVNIDFEMLLESNDLIKYEHDELREKIKQAYDEIFKEGILFGIIVGKIIKLNNCRANKENYSEYLERDYDYYTEYNFKVDFFKKIIPPIKIRKSTRETKARQLNYRNKKYEERRKVNGINVNCEADKEGIYSINEEIIEYKERIRKIGINKFLDKEKISEELKDKYFNINDKLFEKLFHTLEVSLNNAERACQNYYRFDTFTAHDMFVSDLFANLEGEFEANELVSIYLKYVFFKGVDIGILNGKMFFIYDIQKGFLNYYEIQNMNSNEKTKYLIKELFD